MITDLDVFEIVVALLIGGALLWMVADRLRVPPPAMLALGGTGLAFLPGVPDINLDPGLALALFVGPLVLDAAYDASLRDLRDNIAPVLVLVVVLVCLTAAAVAVVARWLLPDLSWPAALALGAVVAPPDAAAASAVLRRLSPPHRLLVILEGEGLLNDAVALMIFQIAVGAATEHRGVLTDAPLLAADTLGGLLLGVVLGFAYVRLPALQRQASVSVLVQFLGTFTVWLLAERLSLSPILTTVGYAAVISRNSARTPARMRIMSFAVWDVATTTLTILAFVLIGLQLDDIVRRIGGAWGEYARFAGAVCATVIGVRLAWVMSYNTGMRLKNRFVGVSLRREAMTAPTASSGLVVGWAGMRGIITLATALALPETLPHRGILVFAAYAVVLATLVGQGMTLGPLLRLLRLEDDGSVAREAVLAEREAARAGLAVLDAEGGGPAAEALRREYELVVAREDVAAGRPGSELAALHARMIAAQRNVLGRLRREARIGDDAFRAVEEDLDWAEANAERRSGG